MARLGRDQRLCAKDHRIAVARVHGTRGPVHIGDAKGAARLTRRVDSRAVQQQVVEQNRLASLGFEVDFRSRRRAFG